MVKIIHCADWHLCAPQTARLDPRQAEERRTSLLSRFAAMIDYARDNGVRAVLLSGDLSDNGLLPHTVQDDILDRMAAVPDIRFFLISGNHDRISPAAIGGCFSRGRRPIPDNLTVFGGTWETYALTEEITVTGISFDGVHAAPPPPSFAPDTYNIVMVHGAISTADGALGVEDGIPLPLFMGKNVDYLALGHYHTLDHGPLDGRGIRCYPGCPVGRGFDECGTKGFVLLKTQGVVRRGAEFVPFADRTWHMVEVDVTDTAHGAAALEDAVFSALGDISEDDLVRVVLCGEEAPEVRRGTAYLSRRLSERFYYAEVKDSRRTRLDPAQYRYDVSLRGEFVRRVLSASELSEEDRADILRLGLSVLDGEGTERI